MTQNRANYKSILISNVAMLSAFHFPILPDSSTPNLVLRIQASGNGGNGGAATAPIIQQCNVPGACVSVGNAYGGNGGNGGNSASNDTSNYAPDTSTNNDGLPSQIGTIPAKNPWNKYQD